MLLGAALTATALAAQSPASPSLPNTPAGTVVKAWYDAYGSGDTLRVLDFYRRYQPERVAQNTVAFRTGSGGFDILSIERAEPRRMEFLARERKTPQTYYAAVDLSPTDPPLITSSYLIAMGPNATVETARIDAAGRAKVIDGAIAKLDSFYVFPDVAKRMADSLRARRTRGAYDTYTNAISFSMKLNRDVGELGRDKHMRVNYSVRPIPPRPATPPPPSPRGFRAHARPNGSAQLRVRQSRAARRQRRLREVQRILRRRCLRRDSVGGHEFRRRFARIDRRPPRERRWLTGHGRLRVVVPLLHPHTPQRSLDSQNRRDRGVLDARRHPGAALRRRETHLYVLTSANTFSGAEEFSYNLKSLKRATIVGETTGGGAHPVSGHAIDEHFMIGVPFARAVNPITRTNWEGVGVVPECEGAGGQCAHHGAEAHPRGVRQ